MTNVKERRKNVYELVQERLDFIFREFDNIYISFSGGKIAVFFSTCVLTIFTGITCIVI